MKNNIQKLIKELRNRLNWYQYNAEENQINRMEIDAIFQLLLIIDPDERNQIREKEMNLVLRRMEIPEKMVFLYLPEDYPEQE